MLKVESFVTEVNKFNTQNSMLLKKKCLFKTLRHSSLMINLCPLKIKDKSKMFKMFISLGHTYTHPYLIKV